MHMCLPAFAVVSESVVDRHISMCVRQCVSVYVSAHAFEAKYPHASIDAVLTLS